MQLYVTNISSVIGQILLLVTKDAKAFTIERIVKQILAFGKCLSD